MLEYNQLDSITLLEVITISFQVLSLKKKKKKKKKKWKKYKLFKLLFGCPMTNFRLLSKWQPLLCLISKKLFDVSILS